MNIVDAFLFQARHQPTALAVCLPGSHHNTVSYARLEMWVNNVASRARAAGLKRADVIAIVTADPVFNLALTLGLTRIGAATLSPSSSRLPAELQIDAVLTDVPGDFQNAKRVMAVDQTWMMGTGEPPAAETAAGYGGGSAGARIVLTSGTTGDPKAVLLSHEMMLRRLQAYDVAFGNVLPTCGRFFLDLGIAASFGYTWMLYILARGGAIFLRGSDPAETMQAFDLYKVQCMIAAPSGVSQFLDYYERSPAFTCPFEVMLASGSLLSRALSERVRARMCANLLATYGSTEISPVAMAPAHRIAHIDGAVGYVAPWVEIEAVDGQDKPLAPGHEGMIRMRGHTCVDGYLGQPVGSDSIFRDGWFYPGDIGTVSEDRLLTIVGRQQAVINVGGDKISPELIETTIAAFPGVIHAAAFSRPNDVGIQQIWAIVTASDDLDLAAVREHCSRLLAPPFVPVKVLQLRQLPLNEMGRVDRKLLPELAASAFG
ncbi:MAG: class I adenylate-forming enzyme family protein [Xanthobacteraceae bacterium]